MTVVTEACKSGAPGRRCPGTITYDVADRRHGSIEFCLICDIGHQWDDPRQQWVARSDLRVARLETD
jgi:hypothetical protein